jgi:hypothetical protein
MVTQGCRQASCHARTVSSASCDVGTGDVIIAVPREAADQAEEALGLAWSAMWARRMMRQIETDRLASRSPGDLERGSGAMEADASRARAARGRPERRQVAEKTFSATVW